MLKTGFLALTIAAFASALSPARASSDSNCLEPPVWSPVQTKLSLCGGLAFLSPGNDTRINLWMLENDENPAPVDSGKAYEIVRIDGVWPVFFAYRDFGVALSPDEVSADPHESVASKFAFGEANRCLSQGSGQKAFVAAVNGAALTPEEKSFLIASRMRGSPSCNKEAQTGSEPSLGGGLKSPLAKIFALYLEAADDFYEALFDEALRGFTELTSAPDPWVREAAIYMRARTLLNKGQVGAFGVDGSQDKPAVKDHASLAAAETAFKTYLESYPKGRYADSAQGLLRRIDWLEGDRKRLTEDYERLVLAKIGNARQQLAFAEEVDNKLFAAGDKDIKNPLFLAVLDLKRLRSFDARNETEGADLSAADLEAQQPYFAGREKLYAYLKAARAFYRDKDAKAALALLGPWPDALASHLDFSCAALRALALSVLGEADAEAEWKNLIVAPDRLWRRETAELGLAWRWERAGAVNKVFMPDSPVRTQRIREILLRNAAGPIILRQQSADPNVSARERAVARFTLLYKDLTRGRYANFLKDSGALEPYAKKQYNDYFDEPIAFGVFDWPGQSELFVCPALKDIIAQLAQSPKDAHSLLCLGEFSRVNGFDGFSLDNPPPADELGGQKSIFPGPAFSRGEIYKDLIANPATPDNERAYAYYRAIHCYAPTGANGCGGTEVDKATRKTWFQTLKSRYSDKPYVKNLRIYW